LRCISGPENAFSGVETMDEFPEGVVVGDSKVAARPRTNDAAQIMSWREQK
jgi:hypothetical protein